MMIEVGNRVRYVGPYLKNNMKNGARKNKKQDLVPGYKGTVIRTQTNIPSDAYPLSVHFDEHEEGLNWPVETEEVVLIEALNTESEK